MITCYHDSTRERMVTLIISPYFSLLTTKIQTQANIGETILINSITAIKTCLFKIIHPLYNNINQQSYNSTNSSKYHKHANYKSNKHG